MITIDRYAIMARVLPAAIVFAPVAATAYVWAPFSLDWAKGSVALFVLMSAAYAFSHATRAAGQHCEKRLFAEWGGLPSTAVLRHRDTTFDDLTKARLHRRLVEIGAVDSMPAIDEEQADPSGADARYAAASHWLRVKTRDQKKFALIAEENINYGFLRNLVGCKNLALLLVTASLVADAGAGYAGKSCGWAVLAAVVAGAYFVTVVTPAKLHSQSLNYAKRLAEAIDQIEPQLAKAKPKKTT